MYKFYDKPKHSRSGETEKAVVSGRTRSIFEERIIKAIVGRNPEDRKSKKYYE